MAEEAAKLEAGRRHELYTAIIATFPLTATHRAELKAKRGFTDDTIDRCRFRSGGEHAFDLVREAQSSCGATDGEMRAAGLLVPRKSDAALFAWGQLLDTRVLIPYLKADGESVYHLRPHKLGFKADVAAIQVYSEYTAAGWADDDTLVLTEGEFKAAAAAQLGYRALAVPGISSFGGQHFDRLQQAIKAVPHQRCVLLFDRETKADPTLPGYKDDFRKRYDVEWWSWFLAAKLRATIGQLPEPWMEQGKIDIDGAVAAGRTRAEFDRVVRGALIPRDFLNALPEEAGAVVARKVRKHEKREKPKGLHIFDSRAAGYGYTWEVPGEDGAISEPVSDFVLQLDRLVQTDEQVERLVRVVNKSGESSPQLTVRPADMASIRAWRQWCATHGDYNWWGKQYHFDAVWTHLHNQHDGSLIRRTVLGGEIEPGLWLFQNGVITSGRYIAPRDDDGLAWVGRRGFEMAETEGQPRILNADPERARTLGDEHREVLELLRENLGAPTGWLSIGWAIATLFSRTLFNRYKCFPILFGMGEAGSGKTTMARWLMNGFFGIDTSGKPMMSTEKSQYRLLAKRCSLSAWFDEFRETRDTARHVTAFCSIYNRQAYSRAKRTGGLETDSVPVHGSLLLGGVVPPHDDQLQSRCVFLNFDADHRDNRAEEDGGTYAPLDAAISRLNELMISAVLRYDELLPDLLAEVEVARKVFQRRTGDPRMALNYAMPVAAFHTLCGGLVDSQLLLEFTLAEMAKSGDRLRADEPLTDFWDAVSSMAVENHITRSHIDADDERIYLWLPGIFQAYEKQVRQRRGGIGFRVNDVKDWISKQPYWVAPPAPKGNAARRDVMRRMNGPGKRVVIVRRDVAPQALLEALSQIEKKIHEPDDFDAQGQLKLGP